MKWFFQFVCVGTVFFLATHVQAQLVRSGTGATATADLSNVTNALDQFRADLGANNGLGVCTGACVPGVGRREVNWDAVPDASSSPAAFPGNFFNRDPSFPAGRVRGIQFSTTGTFEVSADADSDGDGNPGPTAPLFGNHSPDNADDFAAFSAERIFGIVGSNVLDVTFSLPGQPGIPAAVKGFGVVFTDVEVSGSTQLDFFDVGGNVLQSVSVPQFAFIGGDSFKSFSFLGVSFDMPIVSRVRIVNGGTDLNLVQFGSAFDAVAMDDFVFGEPVAIPEPTTLLLALVGMMPVRFRRVG